MITIDGSQGEGGGQVLRSSLALSMATGRAFCMENIRASRPRPGLMRQHLTCVNAAASISGARVTGAEVGSRSITFTPGRVRAGDYHFAIGTAGGTMLVLQAVLPALVRAPAPSRLVVEGGTHNTGAPPFEFFERALLPLLRCAGAVVRTTLDRHGFYPAGGGRVVVEIEPTAQAAPLELLERGERLSMTASAVVSLLPGEIAQRELAVLRARLSIAEHDALQRPVPEPIGPGNVAMVEVRHEHVTEVFSAVGEVQRSAEAVANGLASEVAAYLGKGRPVGPYLADQLMVPLATLAGGRYATSRLTQHAQTNLLTMAAFGARAHASSDGVVTVEALSTA